MSSVYIFWFPADVTTVREAALLWVWRQRGWGFGGGCYWGAGVWTSSIILYRQRWCVQAAARSQSLSGERALEPYGLSINAAWGRCGVSCPGMSFRPPDGSGSGVRAALTLVVSILLSTGTAAGSPLRLEPQVLWTKRGLTNVSSVLLFLLLLRSKSRYRVF